MDIILPFSPLFYGISDDTPIIAYILGESYAFSPLFYGISDDTSTGPWVALPIHSFQSPILRD